MRRLSYEPAAGQQMEGICFFLYLFLIAIKKKKKKEIDDHNEEATTGSVREHREVLRF